MGKDIKETIISAKSLTPSIYRHHVRA